MWGVRGHPVGSIKHGESDPLWTGGGAEDHRAAKSELAGEHTTWRVACHGVSEPRLKRAFWQRAFQVWVLESPRGGGGCVEWQPGMGV